MRKASLLIPCLVDLILPEIGVHTFRLLRRLGVSPVYHREQTCCGQPALNAGFRKQARQAARHLIEVFEGDLEIVSISGSCISTVKHRYPELFEGDPSWRARAEELGARIFELTEYIVEVLGTEDVGAAFEGKVAYHESCHVLRALGISEQPKKLIRSARGTELVELKQADLCCGFGGEFANLFPRISEAMVQEKQDRYLESGADLLVMSEPGCLLNIGGYLSRHHPEKRAVHIASFLAGGGREGTA